HALLPVERSLLRCRRLLRRDESRASSALRGRAASRASSVPRERVELSDQLSARSPACEPHQYFDSDNVASSRPAISAWTARRSPGCGRACTRSTRCSPKDSNDEIPANGEDRFTGSELRSSARTHACLRRIVPRLPEYDMNLHLARFVVTLLLCGCAAAPFEPAAPGREPDPARDADPLLSRSRVPHEVVAEAFLTRAT